jgi:hypothetical protein
MAFFRTNKNFAIILLIIFTTLLVQDLILASTAYAQTSAEGLVKKGVQQYDNAEFELAIETLKQAIQKGLKKKEDIIQAQKFLAFSHAAAGNEKQAKLTYLKLLEISPLFDLSLSESPRLRKPLEQAKKEFVPKDTNPPQIQFTLPTAAAENTALELSAKVIDVSGVASVSLFYKKSSDNAFKQLSMKNTTEDSYAATIPADMVTTDGLALYIQAGDKANNPPSFQGSAKKPLKISVRLVDNEPPVIVHKLVTTAQENKSLKISATVTDRSGINEVNLFHKKTTANKYNKLKMKTIEKNQYVGEIAGKEITSAGLTYYIEATDRANNKPAYKGTEKYPLPVKVTRVDREPPQIVHKPIKQAKENEKINLIASVTDNVGVSQVKINYRPGGKTKYQSKKLDKKSGDTYEIKLMVESPGIEYYFEATDVSGNKPTFWKSSENPYLIKVVTPKPEPAIAQKEKKGSKKLLWIVLGTAVIGGGAAVVLLGGGGESETSVDTKLPDPPSGP